MSGIRLAGYVVVGLAVGALAARADSNVRIVRLSLVVGAVEVNLPDGHGWRPAMLNLPVVAGEQLRTLDSGRAEIQFEGGSTLRLIPDTTVVLTRLATSDSGVFRTTAQVQSGTAFVTLRKRDAKDFIMQLNSGRSVQPDGAAAFRVSGTGAVQVLTGKLRQTAASGGGQTLTPSTAAPAADPWAQWSQERDSYYAKAFREQVGEDDAVTLVNWWEYMGVPMPRYQGTGLAYTSDAACPWTESSGDYKGWCWQESRGWFLPATRSTVPADTAPATSDVRQTNAVLDASLRPNPVQSAGLGFSQCLDPSLAQYGWNFCSPVGTMPYFMDPALLSFNPWQNYGGYVPLETDAGATTARAAHRGPHPSRRIGSDGAIARVHRLGPPPRPRISPAAYGPAFHAAHLSGGSGRAAQAVVTPASPSSPPATGGSSHVAVGGAVHATAPHTVH